MNQEQIDHAFEGRWRIKGRSLGNAIEFLKAFLSEDDLSHHQNYVKSLCRDFFEAGILIGEKATTPGRTIEVVCHDFDYWWNLYELKAGKEKCLQKWNKMSVKDREACIAATPAYVASTPDKQYRKRPLSYLNQKAWNDEIIIRNNPDSERAARYNAAAGLIAEYAQQDSGNKK